MTKVLHVQGKETPYTIDETGRIISLRTGKTRVPVINKGKNKIYHRIRFEFEGITIREYVHRIVAENFIGLPISPLMVVNHKDGNTLNNHMKNLEWVTKSENNEHYYNELKGKQVTPKINHKKIYEEGMGVKVKKGNHIHHIDGFHLNDNLDNLIELTPEEHKWLHLSKNRYLQIYSREELRSLLNKRKPICHTNQECP